MRYKKIFYAISGTLVAVSIIALAVWGLNPAIDFVGGSLLEINLASDTEDITSDRLSEVINNVEEVSVSSIQFSNDTGSFIVRTDTIDEAKKNDVLDSIRENTSVVEVTELRFETVGPTLGRELLIKTGFAILLASIAIMSYVAYQFKDKSYGLAAILAMFHDTIILCGVFAIMGHFRGVEVDVLFVTAVLTTLSFSVHDTIVVFDRVRESVRNYPSAKYVDLINNAITETLPRSLNNSITIIFMLTALALLGGSTIKWFAVALLIGTIAGTYSSTFVAAPILLDLINRKKRVLKKTK